MHNSNRRSCSRGRIELILHIHPIAVLTDQRGIANGIGGIYLFLREPGTLQNTQVIQITELVL